MIFGLLADSQARFSKRTQGRPRFHPSLPTGPSVFRRHLFQCPRSRTAALTRPGTRFSQPLRGPDCTLSCLPSSREYHWLVTQSTATLEPGLPFVPTSDRAKLAEALDVPPHPGADGLVQRASVSCRPSLLNIDCFHQSVTWAWQVMTVIPNTTWRPPYPCGQPGSSSMRPSAGFCRADLTVPRQDVDAPFSPYLCHPDAQRFLAHTQVQDLRESGAACHVHVLEISLAIH